MFDHISLGVSDMHRSRVFYDAVMPVLGYKRLFDEQDLASGYGADRPMFWIDIPLDDKPASAGNGTHVAFAAPSRRAVDEFYAIAIKHGAADAGAPGLRPVYHDNYYAAFVFDPDGHKIEAVKQTPE